MVIEPLSQPLPFQNICYQYFGPICPSLSHFPRPDHLMLSDRSAQPENQKAEQDESPAGLGHADCRVPAKLHVHILLQKANLLVLRGSYHMLQYEIVDLIAGIAV